MVNDSLRNVVSRLGSVKEKVFSDMEEYFFI